MNLTFSQAKPEDAGTIASLTVQLTQEICRQTRTQHFDLDLTETVQMCKEWLAAGHYAAIIGWSDNCPVAVATVTATYALYAGGKLGIIQEFYVIPEFRSLGIGAKLIGQVREYGRHQGWACIELCTPPLPEFERALNFYQNNGLVPVGGRKMRQKLV